MAEGRTAFAVDPDGWYTEPTAVTRFLLERETFGGGVYDPCCGGGNIVTTCIEAGIDAVGTDLRNRLRRKGQPAPAWFLGTQDFLTVQHCGVPRSNLVFNPPYGRAILAEAFIRRAVELSGVDKVCVFVTSKFLFSDGRAEGLYAEIPPDRIYPVRPRPSCPPGQFLRDGGKAEGGVENFVWLVFCVAAPTGRTEFIWSGAGTSDRQEGRPPVHARRGTPEEETIRNERDAPNRRTNS